MVWRAHGQAIYGHVGLRGNVHAGCGLTCRGSASACAFWRGRGVEIHAVRAERRAAKSKHHSRCAESSHARCDRRAGLARQASHFSCSPREVTKRRRPAHLLKPGRFALRANSPALLDLSGGCATRSAALRSDSARRLPPTALRCSAAHTGKVGARRAVGRLWFSCWNAALKPAWIGALEGGLPVRRIVWHSWSVLPCERQSMRVLAMLD